MRRQGQSDAEVAAALTLFDRSEKGVPFTIAGETFVHGEVPETFALPFDGQPVSDAFPSLIAFHFLVLALGEPAYELAPERPSRGDPRWGVAEPLARRRGRDRAQV